MLLLRSFCRSGEAERLKGAVHVGLLLLGAAALAYNAAAWAYRKERHLAVNAVLYGALVWVEVQHVRHHLAEPRPPRSDP